MSDTPLFGPDDRVDDVEALLRELDTTDLELTAPPAEVWSGIEAALRNDDTDLRGAAVTPITGRTTRFRTILLSAAAAVVLIAVGAVVVTSLGADTDTTVATAELVHQADFDPLGADATATATLVELDGTFRIRLDDATLPNPDTNDLELWLIAARADGSLDVQPVSLVDPQSPGTYAVPEGLDPDVYSTVDISIEPRDGDAAHSGRSILRGDFADV